MKPYEVFGYQMLCQCFRKEYPWTHRLAEYLHHCLNTHPEIEIPALEALIRENMLEVVK